MTETSELVNYVKELIKVLQEQTAAVNALTKSVNELLKAIYSLPSEKGAPSRRPTTLSELLGYV